MLVSAAVALAASWAGGLLMLWAYQERLIFYPRPLSEGSDQLAEHIFEAAAADGTKLSGWILPAAGERRGALLYFDGNAGEISSSLSRHHGMDGLAGFAVGGLNYRGYGASEGSPSAQALRADALVAYDEMIEKLGIDGQRLIVIGRSLGSNMAAHVAAKRQVAGLVLVTPYDSVEEIAARRYPIFPVKRMIRHRFDTVAETSAISAPVLIVRSEWDRTVPHASTDRLLTGWAGGSEIKDVTIAGSQHWNVIDFDSYERALSDFAGEALSDP